MNHLTLRGRLQSGDPAANTHPYTESQIEQFTTDVTAQTSVINTMSGRRRSRRVLKTIAVAAAVVLAPVVKFGLQPPISQASADILIQAANSVVADPVIHEGQYWKITTEQWQIDGLRTTHIMYVPAFGDGPKYIGLFRKGWNGGPPYDWYMNNQPKGYTGQWSDPTLEFIASLPTDLTKLRSMLYADAEGHGSTLDGEAFSLATDFLRYGGLPSDVRSRMLQVMATIPYVEISEESVTVDGRKGVGIRNSELVGAYDFLGRIIGDGGLRGKEIILDVSTGEIIGERDFWMGEVMYTASRTRELVDEVPADVIKNARR